MTMNSIEMDSKGCGRFYGPLANQWLYGDLRKELTRLATAERGTNRFFVYEGSILRAAQSTRKGAMTYMDAGKVLIVFPRPKMITLVVPPVYEVLLGISQIHAQK